MAQVTAEQLFSKVRSQAARIAELEMIVDSLTQENGQLRAALESQETKKIAADVQQKGKKS